MAISYVSFTIELRSLLTGKSLKTAGGKCYVTTTGGGTAKATLYVDDPGHAALANPLPISNGRISFALATDEYGMAPVPSVDIFGMSGDGIAFRADDVYPGNPAVLMLDVLQSSQTLVVPFNIADTDAATETDTGFDFIFGMSLDPNRLAVRVVGIDATETIDVGLLSSESGGDADGIMKLIAVGVAGTIKPTIAAGAITHGALMYVTGDATNSDIPEQYVIAAATSLTYTLTAGTDTASGYLMVGYNRWIESAL